MEKSTLKWPKCGKSNFKTQKGFDKHVSECYRIACIHVVGNIELQLPYDQSPFFKPSLKLNSWDSFIDERSQKLMELKTIWSDTESSQYSSWCMIEIDCLEKDLKKAKKMVFNKMKEITDGLVWELVQGMNQLKKSIEKGR